MRECLSFSSQDAENKVERSIQRLTAPCGREPGGLRENN